VANQSDQTLLVRIQQGDHAAIEFLIARYQRALFNFVYRFLNDSDAAADVCQHAFIQLFTHASQLHADESLKAWIFRVARHRCLDELRRRRTTTFSLYESDDEDGNSLLEQVVDNTPLPSDIIEFNDLQVILSEAIAALPDKYREVVSLRYAADLSFTEIGAILNIPEATAKTHFHRAKPLLRELLRKKGITRPIG
jgi:RNA polymerase sigma factor (sigma-70 family)